MRGLKMFIGWVCAPLILMAAWYLFIRPATFSAKVANYRCKSMPCFLRLSEVFPFQWDELMYFDSGSSQEEIDRTVGTHVSKGDLQATYIFLLGHKVVKVIHEDAGVETPNSNEVVFDEATVTHPIFARDTVFNLSAGDGAKREIFYPA